MKNKQEAIHHANALCLQIRSVFKLTGLHLSWWKSGKLSEAEWMCASWRRAPFHCCCLLSHTCLLISREHAAQSMEKTKNCTKHYITTRERTFLSVNILMDDMGGYQDYIPLNIEVWGNLSSQTISFANSKLNRAVQLIQVCIIISGFLFFKEHSYKSGKTNLNILLKRAQF